MHDFHSERCVGILLAGGRGLRFDPTGTRDKLQQTLPDGRHVAITAAHTLLSVLSHVIAVVRPGATALAHDLADLGCRVVVCEHADHGMASSLVHALQHTPPCDSWIIALADMPFVQSSTITALAIALADGAGIAVPHYRGLAGNPVGFAACHLPALLQLSGDEGARRLLRQGDVTIVAVDDAGIRLDIDCTADLPVDAHDARYRLHA